MSIWTRLLLTKKIVKVNEIPQKLMTCKSQNSELERKIKGVSFYYLNNGEKLMSVLDNTDNDIMEVINILNSLDKIFKVKYDNIFVRKSDEKILGFSYPLLTAIKEPEVDMNKLVELITDENDQDDLVEILKSKDEYEKDSSISILLYTILWYKVFKYLNANKISVGNLSIGDIIGYDDSYSSKYIYIMNSVAKLKILHDEDCGREEIEIVNLCINYFSNALPNQVFSNTFNNFLIEFDKNYKLYKSGADTTFFDNMNFLEVLYNQYKRLVETDCFHFVDKMYLRCPICNSKDKVLSQDEYEEIFNESNVSLNEAEFTVYCNNSKSYIVLKNNTSDECIRKYIKYLEDVNYVNYSLVYNTSGFFAFCIYAYSANGVSIEDTKLYDYIRSLIEKLTVECSDDYIVLSTILITLRSQIGTLYEYDLTLDISNFKNVLNSFFFVNIDEKTVVLAKPSHIKPLEDTINKTNEDFTDPIIVDIFFNCIKEICNSNINTNLVISDKGFDVINLFDLQIVREYKKFLENEVYDANKVISALYIDSDKIFYSKKAFIYQRRKRYGSSYVVSPRIYKSVLKDDFDITKIEGEYEFFEAPIADIRYVEGGSDIEHILPEYIVYSVVNGATCYVGYCIKKVRGILVKNAFNRKNLVKYDNKTVMKMIYTYYKYMNQYSICNLPVEFLCFDENYTKMFLKYRSISSNITIHDYFYNKVLEKVKSLNLYLGDMITILESGGLNSRVKNLLYNIYTSFTNYCNVHNIWYEGTISRCPICNKYYEFIDVDKVIKSKKLEYENSLYQILSYKTNIRLKLYKFKDNVTLTNGLKVQEVEEKVLSVLKTNRVSEFYKIVKDSKTDRVIGTLIKSSKNEIVPVTEILNKEACTNLTIIKFINNLVKHFEKISYTFANLNFDANLKNFLEYNLFYSIEEKEPYVTDSELLKGETISSNMSLVEIQNLDKLIKYIIVNSKKCYDLRNMPYPEIGQNYLNDILEICKELKDYYKGVDSKFCDKHSIFYNVKDGMCPLCMEEMDEVLIAKPTDKGSNINNGGEALIYSLGKANLIKAYVKKKVFHVDDTVTEELQKIVDEEENNRAKIREELLRILKELYVYTKKDLENKSFVISFPRKLVYAGKQSKFMGFVQDKVPEAINLQLLANVKKCKEYGFITIPSLLEILISYGEGIEYLHNSPKIREVIPDGIILGDVSGKNVLYSRYLKKVAIIDMDSVGIEGYPADILTDDYTDPICVQDDKIVKPFSFDSDWYSYAIICFYILTKVHPFEGKYQDGNMSIFERKEEKISIIGQYKDEITLPSVIVEWDWMPKYLLNAFVDIFENEKRFSILDLLKKAYNEMTVTERYQFGDISGFISNLEDSNACKETQVEKVIEKQSKSEKAKKRSLITTEILAEIKPNGTLYAISSEIIVNERGIYYQCELEKNLICDEELNFEKLDYDSEDEFIENFDSLYYVDEIYVRDGKGVATVVEDEEKYICLVDGNQYQKIYRISDINREFSILHDSLNGRYLLLDYDNTKSYVVTENKIYSYNDVYKLDTSELDYLYDSRVAYVGNSIYACENGYITRINLNTGKQVKLECSYANENAAIKFFSDTIILVTETSVVKITLNK